MFRLFLLFAVGAMTAVVTLSTAEARDGCGRGWYFNGRACVPMDGPRYGGYYAPRFYGPPRPVGSVHCNRYGDCYRSRPHSCSVPGYTIQDGVCKPYRGY